VQNRIFVSVWLAIRKYVEFLHVLRDSTFNLLHRADLLKIMLKRC
jgi:hypothetical protein